VDNQADLGMHRLDHNCSGTVALDNSEVAVANNFGSDLDYTDILCEKELHNRGESDSSCR